MKFKMSRFRRFIKTYFSLPILFICFVILILAGISPLLMLAVFYLALYFMMPASFTVEDCSLRVSIPLKINNSTRSRIKSSLMVVKVKYYELHKVSYSYKNDDDMKNIGNITLSGRYVIESVNGNSHSEYTLGIIMPEETVLYSVKDLRGAINAITRAFPDAEIVREYNNRKTV